MAKGKGKGSNEKDVIFRLGVEAHPKNKQQLDQFGRQVKGLQEQITQLERSSVRSISAEIERARKDIQELRSLAGQSSRFSPSAMGQTTPGPSVASRAAADQQQRKYLLDAMGLGGNKAAEQKTTKELADVYAARQKVVGQFYADLRRQREQAEREEIRGLQATAREADRAAKEKARAAQQATAAEARELKQLEGIRDRSLKEAASNTDRFHSQVAQVAQGVAQFARGLGVLGIAGEENTAKLIQGLAKVQAGFDMVTGAVKTVRAIEKAMTAWKVATTATATAQQASTMAAEKSATVSGTVTAALAAEKTAADAAAAAHARLAAARGASTAAAGARGAAGLISGMGGLGSLLGGLGRIGGGAAAGGGLAGAGGIGAAGAAIAPAAAAVSAVLASIAGGTATYQMGRDIGKYGFMGGATHGSMSDKIGTGWATVGKWTGVARGLRGSEAGVGRLEAEREKLLARQQETRERMQRELDLQRTRWAESDRIRREREEDGQLRAGAMSGMWGIQDAGWERYAQSAGAGIRDPLMRRRMETRAGLNVFQGQLALAQDAVGAMGRDTPEQVREAALQRVASLHERVGGLLREQADTERDIAERRLKGLDDAIGRTKDQIRLQRDAAKEQQDRLKSAAERFGDLDPEQQRRLIEIKRRAETRGYGSLSRDDREALGSVGLERENSMLSQAALERARRAGFDRYFGEGEREKIRAARETERRLQVELKDKRELQVTVEQDTENIVREVSNQVNVIMDRRDRMLADQLRRQIMEDNARLQETRRRERAERVVANY